MPSLDDRDRVVGPVLRELESGTYEKTFLVLDFGSHTLYGYAGRPGVGGAHTVTELLQGVFSFLSPSLSLSSPLPPFCTQNSKELSELTPTIEINCQWITKVRSPTFIHFNGSSLPSVCRSIYTPRTHNKQLDRFALHLLDRESSTV